MRSHGAWLQVTTPLPAVPLKKSDRPHLLCLAFSLDGERRLRLHPQTGAELIWSTVKLRNTTIAAAASPGCGGAGGLRLRVPMGPGPTTLHVYLASNYLGGGGGACRSVCTSKRLLWSDGPSTWPTPPRGATRRQRRVGLRVWEECPGASSASTAEAPRSPHPLPLTCGPLSMYLSPVWRSCRLSMEVSEERGDRETPALW